MVFRDKNMKRKILITAIVLLCGTWLLCNETDSKKTKYDIEMVYVKGGTFKMGCSPEWKNCELDELPAHDVKVSDFYIGKYEVTQKQWREVIGTDARQHWYEGSSRYGEGDNYPMYYVSWYEAVEFCNKLSELTGRKPVYIIDKTRKDANNESVWENVDNKKWVVTAIPKANGYRLPTEAEWEYAARGGKKSNGYQYSGSNDIEEIAWYGGNTGNTEDSHGKTHPVGTKKANELGIYDMSGNVWEWVFDWYGKYGNSRQADPKGAVSGVFRVNRGGSWYPGTKYARVFFRGVDISGTNSSFIGFRLALGSK